MNNKNLINKLVSDNDSFSDDLVNDCIDDGSDNNLSFDMDKFVKDSKLYQRMNHIDSADSDHDNLQKLKKSEASSDVPVVANKKKASKVKVPSESAQLVPKQPVKATKAKATSKATSKKTLKNNQAVPEKILDENARQLLDQLISGALQQQTKTISWSGFEKKIYKSALEHEQLKELGKECIRQFIFDCVIRENSSEEVKFASGIKYSQVFVINEADLQKKVASESCITGIILKKPEQITTKKPIVKQQKNPRKQTKKEQDQVQQPVIQQKIKKSINEVNFIRNEPIETDSSLHQQIEGIALLKNKYHSIFSTNSQIQSLIQNLLTAVNCLMYKYAKNADIQVCMDNLRSYKIDSTIYSEQTEQFDLVIQLADIALAQIINYKTNIDQIPAVLKENVINLVKVAFNNKTVSKDLNSVQFANQLLQEQDFGEQSHSQFKSIHKKLLQDFGVSQAQQLENQAKIKKIDSQSANSFHSDDELSSLSD